jgi:hypothetical protein
MQFYHFLMAFAPFAPEMGAQRCSSPKTETKSANNRSKKVQDPRLRA